MIRNLDRDGGFECSECGVKVYAAPIGECNSDVIVNIDGHEELGAAFNFCPNCGAEMGSTKKYHITEEDNGWGWHYVVKYVGA